MAKSGSRNRFACQAADELRKPAPVPQDGEKMRAPMVMLWGLTFI